MKREDSMNNFVREGVVSYARDTRRNTRGKDEKQIAAASSSSMSVLPPCLTFCESFSWSMNSATSTTLSTTASSISSCNSYENHNDVRDHHRQDKSVTFQDTTPQIHYVISRNEYSKDEWLNSFYSNQEYKYFRSLTTTTPYHQDECCCCDQECKHDEKTSIDDDDDEAVETCIRAVLSAQREFGPFNSKTKQTKSTIYYEDYCEILALVSETVTSASKQKAKLRGKQLQQIIKNFS